MTYMYVLILFYVNGYSVGMTYYYVLDLSPLMSPWYDEIGLRCSTGKCTEQKSVTVDL
jgi:hypothetical protein